jgi:MFS family permease
VRGAVSLETRTLLGAQLVFNIGFYAVVPFLALAMSGEFGMGAAAIGLVLGARTFSQQGMFLLGGLLADRWGARRSILLGCCVRISGYAVLLGATGFSTFLLGAVLTGTGGALFSPALEAQLSHADEPAAPGEQRRSVFVWLAVVGEAGAVVGPVLGSALLGWGFDAALTAGIAVFGVVTVVLWWLLPSHERRPASVPEDADLATGRAAVPPSLRERRFVAFCLLGSVNLFCYHQLYFAVPVELDRRGLEPALLGGLFLLASVQTLTLQLAVSGVSRRIGTGATLVAGFGLLAAAFSVLAVSGGGSTVVPVAVTVAVLVLGRMLLTPTLLALVPSFVPDGVGARGSFYGLLATCGGVAVLVGNAVLGRAVDLVDAHGWWPGAPWLLVVAAALVSATVLPRLVAGRP